MKSNDAEPLPVGDYLGVGMGSMLGLRTQGAREVLVNDLISGEH